MVATMKVTQNLGHWVWLNIDFAALEGQKGRKPDSNYKKVFSQSFKRVREGRRFKVDLPSAILRPFANLSNSKMREVVKATP